MKLGKAKVTTTWPPHPHARLAWDQRCDSPDSEAAFPLHPDCGFQGERTDAMASISCQWLSLLLLFLYSPSCGSCTGDKRGVISAAVQCSRDKPLFGAVTLLKSCEPESWQPERGKKKECSGISNSCAPSQAADSRHQTGPGKPLFHTQPWLCTEKLSTVYIFIQRRVFLYSDTRKP